MVRSYQRVYGEHAYTLSDEILMISLPKVGVDTNYCHTCIAMYSF